jgi:hypothetical protein
MRDAGPSAEGYNSRSREMLKKDVELGAVYLVKVSGRLARVRLVDEIPKRGWLGKNLDTGREVFIKFAMRLRKRVDNVSV